MEDWVGQKHTLEAALIDCSKHYSGNPPGKQRSANFRITSSARDLRHQYVAAYMYHYTSHAANDVDPSDDKDMLLIGPAKDIAFNCLLATLYNLIHAPHIQRATVPFFPSPSFPKDSHHRGATSCHQRRAH
ncbi:hypothetical protein J4E82_008508 [Alternaria postmessia]|uniref:uncharacterized protein n=1 Tax=Alternaria postmessia TaxID=1187938 RepID=UPI0022249412|nr:uncharacterized protein J4E82_008508 [Alternaria postmessia]KAI5372820.1 hypothetical protein J4E82_008508 [Alternaria postmessia]